MTNFSLKTNSLISSDIFQLWRCELNRINGEIASITSTSDAEIAKIRDKAVVDVKNLNVKRQDLEKLIKAAKPFAPVNFNQEESKNKNNLDYQPTVEKRRGRKLGSRNDESWVAFMHEILEKENRGMLYKELKEALIQTPIATKLSSGKSNTFYTAIDVLVGRNLAVKHNGMLYSKQAFLDSGLTLNPSTTRARVMGKHFMLYEAIKGFLRTKSLGAARHEILEEMTKDDQCREALRHRSYIYTVLTNLEKKKEIKKEGETYYIN